MGKFKICIIGCGGITAIAHGPSLKAYQDQYDNIELTACCDIIEDNADKVKDLFGFKRSYSNWKEMLEQENPDAVSLIVPPSKTKDIAVQILEMGYPLLMEKPPGLDSAELQAIMKSAQCSGTANSVAFNRRHMPFITKLKEYLDQNNMTPDSKRIKNIHYSLNKVGRDDSDFSTTAIHGIDTVKYIVGSEYKSISFSYQQLLPENESVVNIFMDCLFVSGVRAQISFCPLSGMVSEDAIITTNDQTIVLELPIWNGTKVPGSLSIYEGGKKYDYCFGEDLCESKEFYKQFFTNGFYEENRAFFEAIRKGNKPACSVDEALQSVEISECIRSRQEVYKINSL